MPNKAPVNGIELYYEETGSGYPLIFCHEFAGDLRSWEPQVRHFSRRYRVITYNARGYPPSDVPNDVSAYSQMQAVEDIVGLMKHLQLPQSPFGGPLNGRLCSAASRPQLSESHPFFGGRGLWLRVGVG